MSVQNLCFGRLFNKKIDMKYVKILIIVQMWATSTSLVGLQYIDKKWSCQPDLVDAQNTDYLV